MGLKGKTLFMTGGSRGIGLAIGLKAARDGANVAIAAKTAEPHKHLPGTIYTAAEEIEKAGGKALPLICDVRDEAQVYAAVARTVETFGGIDMLLNNASAISLTGTLQTDMLRSDAPDHRAGNFPDLESLHPTPQAVDKSSCTQYESAAGCQRQMVGPTRRLYIGQTDDGDVYAGDGGRVQGRRYCLQFTLAAHGDCYRGH